MLLNVIERIYAAKPSIDEVFDATQFNPDSAGDLNTVATRIIEWIIWIGSVLIFIYMLISGIMIITANGNAEQAKKGLQGLLYGIIGILVIALAWVLSYGIARFVGGGAA